MLLKAVADLGVAMVANALGTELGCVVTLAAPFAHPLPPRIVFRHASVSTGVPLQTTLWIPETVDSRDTF